MATRTTLLGLAKPDYSDVQDVGVINGNMEIIDKEIGKRTRAHNLLDNSDFTDPVNQEDETSYTGQGLYTIDRWKQEYNGSTVTVGDNGLTVAPGASVQGWISQYYAKPLKAGAIVTAYIKLANGTENVFAITLNESTIYLQGNGYIVGISTEKFDLVVNAGDPSVTFEKVALYEGEYNSDTVPTYQPKGYSAELTACLLWRRYIYRVFGSPVGNLSREAIILDPPMKDVPEVKETSLWKGSEDAGYTVQAAEKRYVDMQYTGWGSVSLILTCEP